MAKKKTTQKSSMANKDKVDTENAEAYIQGRPKVSEDSLSPEGKKRLAMLRKQMQQGK